MYLVWLGRCVKKANGTSIEIYVLRGSLPECKVDSSLGLCERSRDHDGVTTGRDGGGERRNVLLIFVAQHKIADWQINWCT